MKSRRIKFFLYILLFGFELYGAPSHVVTFFFEKHPSIDKEKNVDEILTVDIFKDDFNTGIPVTYFGYHTISDNNGQVSFQRKHQDPHFFILVSLDPEPIFMFHNTISHWEVKNGQQADFYEVTREQDEKTTLHFWSVKKIVLPENRRIPLNCLVIHAEPSGLAIQTGITVTTKDDQLLLPTIYVTSDIKISESALAFLQSRIFYGPIQRAFQANRK